MRRALLFPSLISLALLTATGCNPTANVDGIWEGGIQYLFSLDQYGNSTTEATLRKITQDVPTKYGKKTLKIWVSNDAFGSGCSKQICITQEMVDALSQSFLQPGEDNDIYDWDTAIYGAEWGKDAHTKFDNLIDTTDTIEILLTDIDGDNNPRFGTIGYFYAKDNYLKHSVPGSNERIMFYIDSVMFANDTGGYAGWGIDDPYPQEVLSTLAHEFQHMIHFYQKTIRLTNGISSQTWLDEMLAETTEDIVATRIGIPGPRHVDPDDGSAGRAGNKYGRYPMFNRRGIHLSVSNWSYQAQDYSKVSSFGTYLIRNYGGAKLLHDILHNQHTDYRAILDAVHRHPSGSGKTFDTLLREWGTAVLLSDKTNLPDAMPHCNTGEFTLSHFNGIDYEMGSINYFNYSPSPDIQLTLNQPAIRAHSNFYYLVGTDINGTHELAVDLARKTEATLVIRNHTGPGVSSGSDTTLARTENDNIVNITVTAGTKTYAAYLAKGQNLNLKLKLGTQHKDVYLLLTNTHQYRSDRQTFIYNPLEKQNIDQTPARQKAYSPPVTTPQGIVKEVHRFNHAVGSFLHAATPNLERLK